MDPNNLDPDLKKLLANAGISESDLKDEETAQAVYNVIQQAGGMDAVKQQANQQGEDTRGFWECFIKKQKKLET